MCTVTIIPKGNNDFILTSNRDEAPNRKTIDPDFYLENDTMLLYPKDSLAGGTWVGVSEKNRLICLLNGGFTLHKRQENYRLSRGVVVKDLLISNDVMQSINAYNLDQVEPFTIVVVDWNSQLKFYELVWDGEKKHVSELPLKPRLWSSSTLYNESMKEERKLWFEDFKENADFTAESILHFHKTTHNENKVYGLVMDRDFVKTTSITQITKTSDKVEMRFENLQKNEVTTSTFLFSECAHD